MALYLPSGWLGQIWLDQGQIVRYYTNTPGGDQWKDKSMKKGERIIASKILSADIPPLEVGPVKDRNRPGLYYHTQAKAREEMARLKKGGNNYVLQYLLDWHTGYRAWNKHETDPDNKWAVYVVEEPEVNEFGPVTP